MAFGEGLMDKRHIGPFCVCMKEAELKNGLISVIFTKSSEGLQAYKTKDFSLE